MNELILPKHADINRLTDIGFLVIIDMSTIKKLSIIKLTKSGTLKNYFNINFMMYSET